jgi:hypothetical protein
MLCFALWEFRVFLLLKATLSIRLFNTLLRRHSIKRENNIHNEHRENTNDYTNNARIEKFGCNGGTIGATFHFSLWQEESES